MKKIITFSLLFLLLVSVGFLVAVKTTKPKSEKTPNSTENNLSTKTKTDTINSEIRNASGKNTPTTTAVTSKKTIKAATSLPVSSSTIGPTDSISKEHDPDPALLRAANYTYGYATSAWFADLPIETTQIYHAPIDANGHSTVSRVDELNYLISNNQDRAQFLQNEKLKREKQIEIMQNVLSDSNLYNFRRSEYSSYINFLNDRIAVIDNSIIAWPARYKAWQDELVTLQAD